ncbi:MAG TPA: NIPSNAP family protein [Rhizomicrobium sp.]|nr:NIPSNAP family protein [Rhizomicrobium sp.]
MNNVVELRQYTLKPGQRDTLIALFERAFVESQEAQGIALLGTFRDLDDPDRFVWLRGFADMEGRARSLAAFYGGPIWKTSREAANATMIDSDNVLLLRPAWSGSGLSIDGPAPSHDGALSSDPITATICYFDQPAPQSFIDGFRDTIWPATNLAAFVTEPGTNTFPALPVREGENVFVWLSANGTHPLPPELERELAKPVEALRLAPTARSRLHGA